MVDALHARGRLPQLAFVWDFLRKSGLRRRAAGAHAADNGLGFGAYPGLIGVMWFEGAHRLGTRSPTLYIIAATTLLRINKRCQSTRRLFFYGELILPFPFLRI